MNRLLVAGALLISVSCAEAEKKQEQAPAPKPWSATSPARADAWSQRLRRVKVDRLDSKRAFIEPAVPMSAMLEEGRPAILAFFATYCPPCIEEMPIFERLHKEGHVVAAVSLDANNRPKLARLLDDHAVTYPTAIVTQADLNEVGQALNGVPTTMIISPEGRVLEIASGRVERAGLLRALGAAAQTRR